jgi:endonuclease YncB( thermonuclease family)
MIRTREAVGIAGGGAGLLVLGVVIGATTFPPGPQAGVVAPVGQPGAGGRGHECVEVTRRVFGVRRVIDGDTFVVEDYDGEPTSVRIIGIDAPERGEVGYDEARDALAAILWGSAMMVELEFADPERKRDAFGRLLCEVVAFERGKPFDVGERQIESGVVGRYRAGQSERGERDD